MNFNKKKQRWSLRKLSVGLASIMLGVTFVTTSQSAKAETVNTQSTTEQVDSKATDKQASVQDNMTETTLETKEQNDGKVDDITRITEDSNKENQDINDENQISDNQKNNETQNNQNIKEETPSKDENVDTASSTDIERDAVDSAQPVTPSYTYETESQNNGETTEKNFSKSNKKENTLSTTTGKKEKLSTSNRENEEQSIKDTKENTSKQDSEKERPSKSTVKLNNDSTSSKNNNVKVSDDKKKTRESSLKNPSSSNPQPSSSTTKNNSNTKPINSTKSSTFQNTKVENEKALEELKKQNSLKTKEIIDQYSDLLKSISEDDWKEGFPEEKDATVKTDGMDIKIGKVEDGPFPLVNNTIKGSKNSYTYVNSNGIDSRFGFISEDNHTDPFFIGSNDYYGNEDDNYYYTEKNNNLIILHDSRYKAHYVSGGGETEKIEKDEQGHPIITNTNDGGITKDLYDVDYKIKEYVIVTPDGDVIHKIDFKNIEDDPNANKNWKYYVLIDTSLNNDDGTSLHSTGKGKNGIYLTNDDLLYGIRGLGDSEVYAVDYANAGYGSNWQDSDVLASNYNTDEKITGKDYKEIKDTAFRIMTPEETLKDGDTATIWYYEVPMIDTLNESLSEISDQINHDNAVEEENSKSEKEFANNIQKVTTPLAKGAKIIDVKDKVSDVTKGGSDIIEEGIKSVIGVTPVGKEINMAVDSIETANSLMPAVDKSIGLFKKFIASYRKTYRNISQKFISLISEVKNKMILKNYSFTSLKNKVEKVKSINKNVLKETKKLDSTKKNLQNSLSELLDKVTEGAITMVSDVADEDIFSLAENGIKQLSKIKVLENSKVLKWINSGLDSLKEQFNKKDNEEGKLRNWMGDTSKGITNDKIIETMGNSLGDKLSALLIQRSYDPIILNIEKKFNMRENKIIATLTSENSKKNKEKLKKLMI